VRPSNGDVPRTEKKLDETEPLFTFSGWSAPVTLKLSKPKMLVP